MLAGILAVTSTAAPPAWWAQRGATDANPTDDDAVVNLGQLKHFTRKAADELNGAVPGGAGRELDSLIQGWIAGHPDPKDFDAINAGQVKWIASKIHARLIYLRWEDNLPAWLAQAATDDQLANLGQLKTAFNFDLSAPVGQLPEWWQSYFWGFTGVAPGADEDGDGISNLNEFIAGTGPVYDVDNDGLDDWWEESFFWNLDQGAADDPDGDGIINIYEYLEFLDPLFKDSDLDWLQDDWEIAYFGSLAQSGAGDPDGDGLTNDHEYWIGSDPTFEDADLDLWLDSLEILYFGNLDQSPGDDFDSDGISNIDETTIHGSDPSLADSNGDGISDSIALQIGIALVGEDSDGDGVSNADEIAMGTDPGRADTDGDGVADNLDLLPLDPGASSIPPGGSLAGPPVISVVSPPGAVRVQ